MLQGTMYLYINAVERLPVHIVSFIYWRSNDWNVSAIYTANHAWEPWK